MASSARRARPSAEPKDCERARGRSRPVAACRRKARAESAVSNPARPTSLNEVRLRARARSSYRGRRFPRAAAHYPAPSAIAAERPPETPCRRRGAAVAGGAVIEQQAPRWPNQRSDQLQQGRLAAPRRTDKGDEFVFGLTAEIDILESRDAPAFRRIGFVKALNVDLIHYVSVWGQTTAAGLRKADPRLLGSSSSRCITRAGSQAHRHRSAQPCFELERAADDVDRLLHPFRVNAAKRGIWL